MKTARFWLSIAVYAVVLGVAGFLLLRPSPYAGELPWIPGWIAQWADTHGTLRTLVLAVGVCFLAGLIGSSELKARLRRIVIAGLLLLAFEVAQIWIPARTFTWADMRWTGIGTLAVVLLFVVIDRIRLLTGGRDVA